MQACISLGIKCYTEIILKKYGLKKYSSFFGSINIKSIDKLIEVLEDDYKDITNKDNINYIPSSHELYPRCLYSKNDDMNDFHSSTFSHHDLNMEEHYMHFQRCIERMHILRDKQIKTLFIYCNHYTDNLNYLNDINKENCEKLVECLKQQKYNFHILFVKHTNLPQFIPAKIEQNKEYTVTIINNYGTNDDGTKDDVSGYYKNMLDLFKFNLLSKDELFTYPNLENQVTIVITSCNRSDLLKRTLDSFIKYNTYPITNCIIIEDSDVKNNNDFVYDMNLPFPVELIYNEKNIGQVPSIEKAYEKVTTPWIFHCEEDWEFYNPDFIQHSMDILKEDDKIMLVWLRQYGENPHPVEPTVYNNKYRRMSLTYHESGTDRIWSGFTFNPSLRRKKDYDLVKPFTECCKPYYNNKSPEEYDLQRVYKDLGFYTAITLNKEGFVRHIGWDRHIERK